MSSPANLAEPETAAAAEIVERFLVASMVPDPATAALYIADDLKITFTGGRKYGHPRETAAFNAKRYKWVKKKMERTDVVPGHGETIVYNLGTLYGEWPDGTPFEGNRYVDRFVVRGGKIVQMDVWNDSAERLLTGNNLEPYDSVSNVRRLPFGRLRVSCRPAPRHSSTAPSRMSRACFGSRGDQRAVDHRLQMLRHDGVARATSFSCSALMIVRCSLTAHSDECGRL